MKTTKLVIGILSIILSVVIFFQSFIVGFGEALFDSDATGGAGGVILSFFMLAAGIVGIATCSKKAGGIVAGCLYGFGALMGYANSESFADLEIWSTVALICAIVFIFGSIIFMRKKKAKPEEVKEEEPAQPEA